MYWGIVSGALWPGVTISNGGIYKVNLEKCQLQYDITSGVKYTVFDKYLASILLFQQGRIWWGFNLQVI